VSFGCGNLKIIDQSSPTGIQKEGKLALNDSDLGSVLEYYRHLYSSNEEELNQAYAQAQQKFSEHNQAVDRIRLILLLSLPHVSFKDYDRSLALIQDYLSGSNSQDSALKDFLFFLSSFVQELKTQQQQYQDLDQRLKEEKKQKEVLQQKLEELKAIEKTLQERENKKSP
jgi:hypothetical protein